MVCEIFFEIFDDFFGKMFNLCQQMMCLMSGEIKGDQDMILLFFKKNVEECLVVFIYNFFCCFVQCGFLLCEFWLIMICGDIGNYFGFIVEIISCLLGCFQKSGMLVVKGKYIIIENSDLLVQLVGQVCNVV